MQLGELINASVPEVAALPVSVHAALANEYAELQARTKRIGTTLDAALEMAYGGKNEPGTSHVERDGYDVKVQTGKRVDWDKDMLYGIFDELGDGADYIEWNPNVPEARYVSAPLSIKKKLDPARTVKLAKSKITITKKE